MWILAFVHTTDYNIPTLLVVDVGSTSIGMLHAFKHVCGGNEHRKRNFTRAPQEEFYASAVQCQLQLCDVQHSSHNPTGIYGAAVLTF